MAEKCDTSCIFLTILCLTFDDIYDAIVDRGVTPTGGVDTFAEAVDKGGIVQE